MPVDGEVEGPNPGYSHPTHPLSKKGCVIVEKGTEVDCPHCDEVHDTGNDELNQWVPQGHGYWIHWKCPNQLRPFAAEAGTNRYSSVEVPEAG